MYLKKFFGHLCLVMRHKWRVLINCTRCGLLWRGLVHDLSKLSPTEFFESVKFYQGNRSPIGVCRREMGVSYAWLHHKGRNKHHLEYWLDGDCPVQPLMPYKYAVECVCDKLAATRTYAGKSYTADLPLAHFRKYGNRVPTNQKSLDFIDRVLTDMIALGEAGVLNKKYMMTTYEEVCLSER